MKQTLKLLLALLSLALLLGCAQKKSWYKGNTHAHTVICGHADSPPEVVAKWYLDHDYNFLILSEHDHFIDPDSVTLPKNRRKDFILIPGEEVSGPRTVHSTAMNIEHLVSKNKELEEKSEIIQNHVDITRTAGGKTILNHPNYRFAISKEDIFPVNDLYMFELYNGHPLVKNEGDSNHVSTEVLWDELLTHGMTVYGVSSDDAHYFVTIDSLHSNPGRGWVIVNAEELSADAITEALNSGSFYASNGVILSECGVSKNAYRVVIDETKTAGELDSPELRGRRISSERLGFTIEFIGPDGFVLTTTAQNEATFPLAGIPLYVRPRITFIRDHKTGGQEAFYAWGQPVFTDGRAKAK